MAWTYSGLMEPDEKYQLGDYNFELKVQYPGDIVSVFAICKQEEANARELKTSEFPFGTKIKKWHVDTNETISYVYILTDYNSEIDTAPAPKPIPYGTSGVVVWQAPPRDRHSSFACHDCVMTFARRSGEQDTACDWLAASAQQGATVQEYIVDYINPPPKTIEHALTDMYTYRGKTVYYKWGWDFVDYTVGGGITGGYGDTVIGGIREPAGRIAWCMVYENGGLPPGPSEFILGGFEIDIREAGGGPGGDWDDPGDTGDPSYTLNVNVTGASAGTHDAADVPMAPADQPVYGSGGAGGNGGGGGAGQSTVIVRRFATDKAGSVNQEVTLRPPGVGGKGGPGGKGGDGCILIFY